MMKWLLLLVPCLLVSCAGQQKSQKPTSRVSQTPAVWLNGAEVRSKVEAMNGEGALGKANLLYAANTANLEGPLHWTFVAEGEAEKHRSMTVEGVQISTGKTRRTVHLPQAMLGGAILFQFEQKEKKRFSFKKQKEEEMKPPKWRAEYTLPSSLQLFPKVDGKIVLAAKIAIETTEGTSSEWVNFALLPPRNVNGRFTFRQTMIEYGGVPIE